MVSLSSIVSSTGNPRVTLDAEIRAVIEKEFQDALCASESGGPKPTVAVILANKDGQVLIVKERRTRTMRFPQVVAHAGEELLACIMRAVREEVGIVPAEIRQFCGAATLDRFPLRESQKVEKRRYYYFFALCSGVTPVTPVSVNIVETHWAGRAAALEILANKKEKSYSAKAQSMIDALRSVITLGL